MIRMFRPLFLVATLCAALIAGCGGSSNNNTNSSTSSSSSSASSTTSAAKTSASSTSHTTHSSSTTTAANTTPPVPNLGALSGKTIATYCQSALSAASKLSSAQKAQFKTYCAALAHDNPTQLKAAEKTLCLDILSSVPAAYRSIAKAECSKL